MTKILANWPNRIRERRRERGMSLARLSELTGIDTAYISKMEIGDRRETVPHLRAIANHLGCNVGDLLNKEDNPHSLSATEKLVVNAMRGDSFVAHMIVSLASAAHGFDEN